MQIQAYKNSHAVSASPGLKPPFLRLNQDNWDDFGYKTRFLAEIVLADGGVLELGGVKIIAGARGFRFKTLPIVASGISERVASVGESVAYYRKLATLPERVRCDILEMLGDVVADPSRREEVEGQEVWAHSLMRESATKHALARGGFYIGAPCSEVVAPQFRLTMRMPNAASPHAVELDFSKRNGVPHRIILFIGPNGTGKTRMLAGLVAGLVPTGVFIPKTIANTTEITISEGVEVSRVIAISYNAFDEFPLPLKAAAGTISSGSGYRSKLSYKYCGLRNEAGAVRVDEITAMLDSALGPVVESDRKEILENVLTTLLGPDLGSALCGRSAARAEAVGVLSAGQRLVAAIFCNVIGFIEEGSLLLIDEPETHLHPGLLTSVMSAFDAVLQEFDSYAVMATHSPILLQQVPGHFVRVFSRFYGVPSIRPLESESFGEDIGELSRNVLGLADPEKDFTDVLRRLFLQHGNAEAVEALFDKSLGIPAKAFLYSLEDGSVEPAPSQAA